MLYKNYYQGFQNYRIISDKPIEQSVILRYIALSEYDISLPYDVELKYWQTKVNLHGFTQHRGLIDINLGIYFDITSVSNIFNAYECYVCSTE